MSILSRTYGRNYSRTARPVGCLRQNKTSGFLSESSQFQALQYHLEVFRSDECHDPQAML
jgi:hypothetical protein